MTIKPVHVAALVVLGAAAVAAWRNQQSDQEAAPELAGDVVDGFTEAAQAAAEVIDNFTGSSMKLSAMAQVTPAMIYNGNVQAFLRVIRQGEGTSDEGGYSRLFGGGSFEGFDQHPDRKVSRGGYVSTAAGAYQFLTSTWRETARIMDLRDFSPASQDAAAVGRIAARGALADVIAGRFEAAVRKCAKEWASLPYSPYGQPTISMATAASVYAQAGGVAA